jgi:hypothetical protein
MNINELGKTPDSFAKERLQEDCGVVQPFPLIQFTPGHHLANPSPCQRGSKPAMCHVLMKVCYQPHLSRPLFMVG